MPAPDYTANVRRVFDEVLNKGELDACDELFTADCAGQDPTNPSVRGASGFKQYVAEIRRAFPDIRFTIDEICASGNTVVVRYTVTGTNKGPLPGTGLPPTGKSATLTPITMIHFDASGKSKDWFSTWDTLGQMVQLGVIPQMAQMVPASGQAEQPTIHG